MNRRLFVVGGLAALAGATLSGCHYRSHEPRTGPPPWAPAHGYRRKHHSGVDLVYDSGLGVYVVVGWPHHYFFDDYFYRYSRGHWEKSREIDRHWYRSEPDRVPPGLRRRRG